MPAQDDLEETGEGKEARRSQPDCPQGQEEQGNQGRGTGEEKGPVGLRIALEEQGQEESPKQEVDEGQEQREGFAKDLWPELEQVLTGESGSQAQDEEGQEHGQQFSQQNRKPGVPDSRGL